MIRKDSSINKGDAIEPILRTHDGTDGYGGEFHFAGPTVGATSSSRVVRPVEKAMMPVGCGFGSILQDSKHAWHPRHPYEAY